MNRIVIALLIIIPVFLIALLAMSGIRNYDEDSLTGEVQTGAKDFYNGLRHYADEDADNEQDPPFRDAAYSASVKYDSGIVETAALDNPSEKKTLTLNILGLDPKSYKHDMYFVFRVKDGAVVQVSACRSNILTEAELTPVRRENDPAHLTLAEYFLKRYIAYYPPYSPAQNQG